MIIWFEKTTGRVIAYNDALSKTEEKEYSKKSPDTTIIVEGLPEKSEDTVNPVLFIDLETNEIVWIDEFVETEEPFDNETAMLELLSMTEYSTCLLEMNMDM